MTFLSIIGIVFEEFFNKGERMEQIVESLGRLSLQVLLAFGAVVCIAIIAVLSFMSTQTSGLAQKIEATVNAYNAALSAWAAFAKQKELDNAYPLAIEIEAEKLPFGGLHIKKSIVLVRVGFKEKRYRLVSNKSNNVHFVEEVEDDAERS